MERASSWLFSPSSPWKLFALADARKASPGLRESAHPAVSQLERAAPSQSAMHLLLDAQPGLPQEREARLAEASAEHEVLEQDAACWARALKCASAQEALHEQHAFREACSYFARACQAWFDCL